MKTSNSLAGVLAGVTLLLTGASGALAAGPADVTVRVEGLDTTLVPRTQLRTTETAVNKDGQHPCTGTSAAGALEQAVAGDWAGTWSDSFGSYGVDRIKSASHPFFSGHYWSFYVDDVAQTVGICGRELSSGEDVVFVPQSETAASKPLLALRDVPDGIVAPGQSVTVRVVRTATEYDPNPPYTASGQTTPAAGVAITGPGVSLTTDAQGRASFVPPARGPVSLRATSDTDVRSATEAFCVTDGADGQCGTFVPTTPTAPCRTNGIDGFCGSPDFRAASAQVGSVAEQQRFGRGQGPRELKGTVEADGSGVAKVRLRLVRRDRGRCSRFDDARLEFRAIKRCRITAGKWVTVGETADWSYLLPSRLPRGRYALDVESTDKAGNVNRSWARGRNRVVFYVD